MTAPWQIALRDREADEPMSGNQAVSLRMSDLICPTVRFAKSCLALP
jgi:hypothetical protein